MQVKPYEDSFVRGIKKRIHSAREFRQAIKEGVYEVMGEGSADILLLSSDPATLANPTRFALEMSSLFGQGAIPIFDAILAAAENPVRIVETESETSQLESILKAIGPSPSLEAQGESTEAPENQDGPDEGSKGESPTERDG